VLLPEDNKEEWDELDKDIRSSIAVDFIGSARDAFTKLFSQSIFLTKTEPVKQQRKRRSKP